MRIGIDCRLWNETGVGRYIRNLVWQLSSIDKKNEYVLFFRRNEFDHVELPGNNFRKVLADMRWHTLREQIQFPLILQKENLDLVHFPYFSVPIFYRGSFVVTIHDLIINHYSTGAASTHHIFFYQAKRIAYLFILSQAITHATYLLAPSQSTKKELQKHYKVSPSKIIVTYEGVDNKITHTSKGRLGTGQQTSQYFLYVGNFYPHKNLEVLLKAFTLFHQTNPDIQLIFVGKADFFYMRLKKQIDALHLEKSVLFYEKVSDGGLANLYQQAIALVLPSLMEGFGLPVLEAMASKCLVVCSDIPSFREIAKDSAIYFNPTDVDDIAKKLDQAMTISQKERQQKITSASVISENFSWRKMATQTLACFENAVKENSK